MATREPKPWITRNTHSHHFAGPSPSRGANTRHVVSSACRCQEPRDRCRDRVRERGQQHPGLRARPGQRRRRDVRALPGQPRHQRVHAPPRDEPLRQQHRDEPVGEQALPDRLRRPRCRHRRRHPARAGPPVAAAAVRRHPHHHPPVQLLPATVIGAQPRERLPALRAAVPALEIPDHLNPGQVRVIPPPRPRPRAALLPVPLPRPCRRRAIAARRLRARPLRRPPEHHLLQDRQVSLQLPHLSVPVRITLAKLPDLGLPLRVPLTEPRVLRSAAGRSHPAPRPAHPAAAPQPPPHPGTRPPQPPRSTANIISSRKSRTMRRVAAHGDQQHAWTPTSRQSRDFRILTFVQAGLFTRTPDRRYTSSCCPATGRLPFPPLLPVPRQQKLSGRLPRVGRHTAGQK